MNDLFDLKIMLKIYIFNIMLELPSDLIRHVIKILVNEHPMDFFRLDEEILKIAEYTNEEILSLSLTAIKRECQITKIPFFSKLVNDDPVLNSQNFLKILKEISAIDNNVLFYEGEVEYYHYHACACNNLKILEFLVCIERDFLWLSLCLDIACKNNNLEMLKCICESHPSFTNEMINVNHISEAINHNNLKMFIYLKQKLYHIYN
jgi:hypothetical protein